MLGSFVVKYCNQYWDKRSIPDMSQTKRLFSSTIYKLIFEISSTMSHVQLDVQMMRQTIQLVCSILENTLWILRNLTPGKTLAGMWGHHYEASLEDSCLVPAASRGWSGHSVELQQPTMPEQERRSHGFEVTAIWIGWHVASPQGDLGGGADAEATQICSPTSEQENGQRWRKAQGVEWTLKEEHFLFKLI